MLNSKSTIAAILVSGMTLSACQPEELASLAKNITVPDLSTISGQGCAIGGLGGAVAGGLIGNKAAKKERGLLAGLSGSQGGALGATLGAALGGALGCSTGKIIEERKAKARTTANFYDQQIQLAESRSGQLSRDNSDLKKRIASNNQVIAQLKASGAGSAAQKQRAMAAVDVNKSALKDYRALASSAEKEIKVQEAVLKEIRDTEGNSARSNQLQAEITSLKKSNAGIESSISTLSAQSQTIGGFL